MLDLKGKVPISNDEMKKRLSALYQSLTYFLVNLYWTSFIVSAE